MASPGIVLNGSGQSGKLAPQVDAFHVTVCLPSLLSREIGHLAERTGSAVPSTFAADGIVAFCRESSLQMTEKLVPAGHIYPCAEKPANLWV